jgi:hypothetical protein
VPLYLFVEGCHRYFFFSLQTRRLNLSCYLRPQVIGRRPILLSAILLFALGSTVCGAASSMSMLIMGVGDRANMVYLINFWTIEGISGPQYTRISHSTVMLASLGRLSLHPLIVTWVWSSEGVRVPRLCLIIIFSGVFFLPWQASVEESRFWKANTQSPHTTCFWPSQQSFTPFSNTAARSPSMPNTTMTTFTTLFGDLMFARRIST